MCGETRDKRVDNTREVKKFLAKQERKRRQVQFVFDDTYTGKECVRRQNSFFALCHQQSEKSTKHCHQLKVGRKVRQTDFSLCLNFFAIRPNDREGNYNTFIPSSTETSRTEWKDLCQVL